MQGTTLDSLLGYHLRRASTRATSHLVDTLKPLGLRPVTFSILCLLREVPGLTSSDITRRLGLKSANTATLLGELETRGWIERKDDEKDRRVTHLHLTDTAGTTLEEALTLAREHEEQQFSALDSAERQTLKALLARVWQE